MDQRLAKMLQTVSLGILAWFAYTWFAKLHWMLAAALLLLAIVNVGIIWMLRCRWPFLESGCRVGVVRRYVSFVADCSGEQLPIAASGKRAGSSLLLRSKKDFEIAGTQAKQIIRGHNDVIDGMLCRIFENLTLRQRRRRSSPPGPLASFVLAGRDGIGKRYTTRVLAKLLYRDGLIDMFDCGQIRAEQLVGTRDREGELLTSVRRNGERVICFEHVERADPDVITVFHRLLSDGTLRPAGSDRDVSFQGTVLVFTTTQGAETLASLIDRKLQEDARRQRTTQVLAEQTGVDARLLHGATDVFYCQSPDDTVKSEVVALLLERECRDHRIKLLYVDPEIIATQVLQIDESHGFAVSPQLVRKLMRKPLVAAASDNHESLSLRVRSRQAPDSVKT